MEVQASVTSKLCLSSNNNTSKTLIFAPKMFAWNFAKSAEAMFSQWAIKKVCKFLLKKKLGQLILGDIDLNQLDVQLSAGIIQLSDLALNVDYLNQKFGAAAILAVKEGSIGSLSVKLPWKGRGCQIEVDELELVLAPCGEKISQVGSETSVSGQDVNNQINQDLGTAEHEMVDVTLPNASVDVHEGVKTIAKMVKWLLTSFHVKIKKLIVAFDPSLGEIKKGHCRTLVLRFREVECGTGLYEDVNSNCQATVDSFLGLSRLTNFVKFDGAILEFLEMDGDGSQSPLPCASGATFGQWFSGYCSSNATTQIITGEKGGFSGNIKLSIPWKNGSLDIRKVDADICVDPLELRFQPSSLKSLIYLLDAFEELGKNRKDFMHNNAMESIYYSAASHGHSSVSGSCEFISDKMSQNPRSISPDACFSMGKETVTDALLRGSHLISDWVALPIYRNQNKRTEESDFGASVDQFFECFDELRTSQSALGNSGMWNWTCSVFSAITAASNLASGSLHIPSEQKHVETNLKARIARVVILFSFVDENQKPSCSTKSDHMHISPFVHYIGADFQEMHLVLQVCPRELNLEATVNHLELADYFSDVTGDGLHGQYEDVKTRALLIRNMQAAVQGACPPLSSSVEGAELEKPRQSVAADTSSNMHVNTCSRNCRGIFRDDVVKVMLLRTSAVTQGKFTVNSVSPDDPFAGPKSFSLKLPPLVFWVNFHTISTTLDVIKEIGSSLETDSTRNFFASEAIRGNCRRSSEGDVDCHLPTLSTHETLRGNIFILNARIVLCFPCEQSEDCRSYSSWNQFIVVDFSSPLALSEKKLQPDNPTAVARPKDRYSLTSSRSLHLNMGNLDIYAIASVSKDDENNPCGIQKLRFSAQKILSVTDKAGRPSVFSMFWQERPVTGPWIAKRAKVLATSDGMSCRNKFTGNGYEFTSVTTMKDMEDFNSLTREEIVLSSAFFLHAYLSPVTVNLDSSQYKNLCYLLHQVVDWFSCIISEPVGAMKNSPVSQTSILVECDAVEISVSVEAVEGIKRSIQNEIPGSWHSLKMKIEKFQLLTVSNIGGILGVNFLWVAHDEGSLLGSITGAPDEEFLLISCNNSTRGRGSGEGSNVLSSRLSGSDIIHMWDPVNFLSHVSINIRCGTIVATGGRLDWLDPAVSFFSLPQTENDEVGDAIAEKEESKKDVSCGSSFVLNLVDIGLSYEPYFDNMEVHEHSCSGSSANSNGKPGEQYAAGLLAASTLKLSNVTEADSTEMVYLIKAQDVGLLLCAGSESKDVRGSYSAQNLRNTGYVKVAQEAHVEALLRMNCKDDHTWELECSESHIVLDTCQDTASGLIRLADQLQQLFAPDVEEYVVHLQNRWDNVQQAHESDETRNLSNHPTPSSSQMHRSGDTKREAAVVNLMDEISEEAFSLDGNNDSQSKLVGSPIDSLLGEAYTFCARDDEHASHNLSFTGAVPVIRLENNQIPSSQTSFPEFIEGYFLSDLRPLSELSLNNQLFNESLRSKSISLKDGEARGGSTGWYGDSSLRILENHVLHVGERINSKLLVESKASVSQTENVESGKAKGCVLLKNINIRWRLYAGSDWQYIQKDVQHASICGRDTTVCLELVLSKMNVRYDVFPDGEIFVSRLSLSIQDFRLNDIGKNAPWKQVLGYYQSKDHPRESSSKALKLDLEAVRPHPSTPLEEYRLHIAFLPLRLHLHQCQLDFLISFFGGKSSSVDDSPSSQDSSESRMPQKNRTKLGSHNIREEALLPYFQKFDIWPVVVRVDYSPSRVDLAALRHGKYVELVNLVPWKGVELQLKHVQAVGVYGWSCVCETIIGEWLEDISQNQVHKLLKGLPPIRSLVAVGSSAAKLVSLPVKNYKKDNRIVKGMQRGTISFLRSISLEAIGLGVHLAAGAHDILLQAEYILTSIPPASVPRPIQSRVNTNVRSNQPKDARQGIQQAFESITDGLGKSASALVQTPLKKYQRGAGVGSALASAVQAAPAAAIAPASAAARAMHCALLGVRNSLDPEHKKESMDKYLGTTQSRPF